jgi:hypothetical protein
MKVDTEDPTIKAIILALARTEGFSDPVIWTFGRGSSQATVVVESFDTGLSEEELAGRSPSVQVDEDGEVYLTWPSR